MLFRAEQQVDIGSQVQGVFEKFSVGAETCNRDQSLPPACGLPRGDGGSGVLITTLSLFDPTDSMAIRPLGKQGNSWWLWLMDQMSPLTHDAGLGNYLESLQIPHSSHVTTTGGWQWRETFIAIFTTYHLFACTGFWKWFICWLLSDVECIDFVPNQVSNCLFWHFQLKFVLNCYFVEI